ncbi:GNAT family N-acetyltransferase [Salinibacillus xinjiangensis]|uniref:GNAT family N-acetyltransferase n=1 Tax=Salinibacillus xinjiangensis TaxID=1229268 RepID=UPI0018913586|nr:GNAT family N-acetyltransferase [Salinibacillus xinjiangensis]
MDIQMNQEWYQLVQVQKRDLQDVLELLVQAAKWLQTKNTTQWDYYIKDLEGNTQEVLDSIENNSTFLLRKNGRAIATITLENTPNDWDCEMWEEAVKDEGVVYLHRIVIHREYAGQKLGEQLIDWAKDYMREQGGRYIRFDCLGTNEGLNRYYQKHYEFKGVVNKYSKHCKYEIEL